MKKHLKLRLYGMQGETDIDIDKIIAQYGLSDRGVYNVGLSSKMRKVATN